MHRLILAAVLALGASPAFAQQRDAAPPATDQGYATSQPEVGHAARETGRVLRRGWEGTKQAARETGNALAEGWHTVERGVRWGWNHPRRAPPPQPQPDTGH
jgi:hypothetical protein